MDLALIAIVLLTLYGVAAVAYSAGRSKGRHDERTRVMVTQQNIARLESAALRRSLRERAAVAQYERMRNVERSAR